VWGLGGVPGTLDGRCCTPRKLAALAADLRNPCISGVASWVSDGTDALDILWARRLRVSGRKPASLEALDAAGDGVTFLRKKNGGWGMPCGIGGGGLGYPPVGIALSTTFGNPAPQLLVLGQVYSFVQTSLASIIVAE